MYLCEKCRHAKKLRDSYRRVWTNCTECGDHGHCHPYEDPVPTPPDPRAADTKTFDTPGHWRELKDGGRVRPAPTDSRLSYVMQTLDMIATGKSISPATDAASALRVLKGSS